MNYRWYILALGFFASGLLMGVAFVIAGPVTVVRILGGLAIASSVGGGVIALWTLREDDPWKWALYRFRVEQAYAAVGARLRTLRNGPRLAHA
jgi:hypothetical protein